MRLRKAIMDEWIEPRRAMSVVLAMLVAGCTTAHRTGNFDSTEATPHTNFNRNALDALHASLNGTHNRGPDAGTTALDLSSTTMDQIIGMDEHDIRQRLGAPTSQENQSPTKRWVFQRRQCTMDVTFYANVKTRQFHVLSYEVISDDHSPERNQHCVAAFSSRLVTKLGSN
jgi:hypothetical protein